MTDNKKLFFGLKRSIVDPKERKLSMQQCDQINLPSSFSLKSKVKQVYNQMSMNSCSANAAANFLSLSDKVDCNISRLYMYFNSRYIDNNYMLPVEDIGSSLGAVFTAISSYHYIDEVKYPYEIEMVNSIPPREIFEEAIKVNKCPIVSYRQITPTLYNIKYVLSHLKKPIIFGMAIYNEFFEITNECFTLKMPSPASEFIGNHAVLAIGYCDETQTIEILNSHGSEFGKDGTFLMPYSYIKDNLVFEFYTIS